MSIIPTWFSTLKQRPELISNDLVAGLMMAVLVIPQSLGYATLAGLPPIMGLYASIVPTLVYAYIGSSSVSAVGPVAVTAIMTASALSGYTPNTSEYLVLSIALAMMVGVILCLASLFRIGWIMQFVSRGVSSGFVSAAAVLIIISQLKNITGLPIIGGSLIDIIGNLKGADFSIKTSTALLGIGTLIILLANRYVSILWAWLSKSQADFAKRLMVFVITVLSIILANQFNWQALDLRLLEPLPTGLPKLGMPILSVSTFIDLLPSALLIALVAFISSSAVASNYARIHSQPFDNNKELLGLGFANIASSVSGGFTVAGGISRTSLNIGLGAKTPFASVVCAIGILLILVFFGQYLTGLPYAVLSAIIVSSVISMVDIDTLKSALRHDKADAICFVLCFFAAIIFGLNIGLIAGLLMSFILMIYRSHRVNIAIIGQIGDSGHFRDIARHKATTFDDLLMVRIDESLYFGNAITIHDTLRKLYYEHPNCRDVIIIMTAVNHIDLTAQEMLLSFNQEVMSQGKRLHFAEVKGPIMDILKDSELLNKLSGQVFLSTKLAFDTLKYKGDDWGGM
ncbi:MAG: SulP family inorganic anion transporter [Moraxella sp.]|nr:SulP family inorganic anion transporter [Moraxella sp.]